MTLARPASRGCRIAPLRQSLSTLRQELSPLLDEARAAVDRATQGIEGETAALADLTERVSPKALQEIAHLATLLQREAKAMRHDFERHRTAADRLDGLVGGARLKLQELRRLARAASLVAMNAQVVSGSITVSDGTLDSFAKDMRDLFSQMAATLDGVEVRMTAGLVRLGALRQTARAAGAFALSEVVPCIDQVVTQAQTLSVDRTLPSAATRLQAGLGPLQPRFDKLRADLQGGEAWDLRLDPVDAALARAAAASGPDRGLQTADAAQRLAATAAAGLQVTDPAAKALSGLGSRVSQMAETRTSEGVAADRLATVQHLTDGARMLVDRLARLKELQRPDPDSAAGDTDPSSLMTGVVSGIAELAVFDSKMTILGLNAILVSSRIGEEGRAMSEVSQQLRNLTRDITDALQDLTASVNEIADCSNDLPAAADNDEAGPPPDPAREAADEISRLADDLGTSIASTPLGKGDSTLGRDIAAGREALTGASERFGRLAAMAERLEAMAAGDPVAAMDRPATGSVPPARRAAG
ncbi:hypothetical protein EKE94_03745 [Mesobaculum littorinae]|uniref:Methyl-accepting chemotaxis protein n=1 Tax=Mesobaculum littorinae TaxID=2486419 RepID=A0A438AMH8_9RHOB|nr:hypothetical protein [Mesobaculum littorinae]RVV99797.1 hypothetical protein EKE94_03745 [Mesobaculum littorinae]